MFQFEIQQIKGTRVLASLTYLTSVLDLGMSLLNLAKKNLTSFNPKDEAQKIITQIAHEIGLSRAFLFGSGATSQFNAESDLDIILIFSDDVDLRAVQKKIYSKRWSEWPIDFIIKSESDFEKRKIAGGVCYEASLYGIEMKP